MSSSDTLKKWLSQLAQPEIRIRIHFFLMILGTTILLLVPPELNISTQLMPEDKALHFTGGHLIGNICFYSGYVLLAIRILLFGHGHNTIRLLWLPTAYAILGALVLLIVSIVAGAKELLDSTGMGTVDWGDFTATFDGAYAPNIDAAITLLGLTPSLIPIDMLLQWPEKLFRKNNTGNEEIDIYLKESKRNNKSHPPILLVEDDIACATLIFKFLKKTKLTCHHVDTIADATVYFKEHTPYIKVIILDLFVRVENSHDRRTGADWLEELNQIFPKGKRPFSIIITTGHPEQLGQRIQLADAVLTKPWAPSTLYTYFLQQNLISSSSN